MRHKTFFWFFLPTASAMLLFIAFPIISVITQYGDPILTAMGSLISLMNVLEQTSMLRLMTVDVEATNSTMMEMDWPISKMYVPIHLMA